ncbi:MAG TPA: hypothetical protein VNO33_13040, partial [Kofleriaceae bacterium]|nr:hypothetical protein [Kofleriaceae bacterium]
AASFGIRSIPTIMVIRDGVMLFSQPGALPGELLDELITKVREVDMDEVRQRIAEAEAQGEGEEEDGEEDEDGPVAGANGKTATGKKD